MSAHTPGPWMVGGPFPSVSVCVEIDPGDMDSPPIWEAVCIVDQRKQGDRDPRALADARLIAAAPELLAALVAVTEAIEELGLPLSLKAGLRPALQQADAAIAKAEGKRHG